MQRAEATSWRVHCQSLGMIVLSNGSVDPHTLLHRQERRRRTWQAHQSCLESLGLQPAQEIFGKLPPAAVDGQRVAAAGELLELRDGR